MWRSPAARASRSTTTCRCRRRSRCAGCGQQEARAAARAQALGAPPRSTGRPRWARRCRASRRPCCRTRSTPRRTDGTHRAARPGHRAARCGASSAGKTLVRAAWARTRHTVAVGTDKGEVLAFDDGRQAEVDRARDHRGDRPAARRRRRGRGVRRRRQHPRAQRRATAQEVGEPAHRAGAHRAQLRGRRLHARRPVLRHRRRPAAGARHEHRHRRLGCHGRQPEGRDRARAHRRRHVAAAGRRQPGVRRRLPGPRRVLRRHARHAQLVARRVEPRGPRRRRQEHLRHRRQGRRAGARPQHRRLACGSRTAWPSARSAVRRWCGDFVGVVDVEGYVHLLAAANGAYVGRMATDGTPPDVATRAVPPSILWQSAGGNLYAVSAR